VARLLIEMGARKDQKSTAGSTALDFARKNERTALCKLLLEG